MHMLEEHIKKSINTTLGIRLRYIDYYEKTAKAVFNFLVNTIPTSDVAFEIKKAVQEYIAGREMEIADIEVQFKESKPDKETIVSIINKFIAQKYMVLEGLIEKVEVEGLEYFPQLVFYVMPEGIDLIEGNDFLKDTKEVLEFNYLVDFEIVLIKTSSKPNFEAIKEIKTAAVKKLGNHFDDGHVLVKGVIQYVGKLDAHSAVPIKAVNKNTQNCIVAGKISNFTKRVFKKKNKKDVVENRYLFNFTLNDTTGEIPVTVFATKQTIKKLEKLSDNANVLIFGKVEEFRDKINIVVRELSLIEDFKHIPKKVGLREEYITIFPQRVVSESQIKLSLEEKTETDELLEKACFLKANTVVVLDFETTGLSSATAEVIEIGAVKIVEGKIVETFSSLIRPSKYEIMEDTRKIHGITNEAVKDAPYFKDVVLDFLLFSRGAVLAGHNIISFDLNFLSQQSKELGIDYEELIDCVSSQKYLDTLKIAPRAFPSLKSYKLDRVLKELGLKNKNAHRALDDALATAHALIAMKRFI
ncbi:MAG: exonuclease domain-containing protein [Firmicutes bacterium]|nr:exonuclease domain-containing protein [Bacillota bacterium]